MKIKPLSDRVIIRRSAEKAVTAGGLHIPTNAQERSVEGTVAAVGPGRRTESGELIPMDVGEGDTVLFGKYSGTEVKVDGEDVVIVRQDEIIGVISQ